MMKAFIFAAGRGQRMGVLTESTPKPLLGVNGRCLIEYVIDRVAAAGVTKLIINLAYLGDQIETFLGDGERYGVSIEYSREPYPLETGGGILHALPLLGDKPFLVVNADVWCDLPLQPLVERGLKANELGHLVLVDNPDHNPAGDFAIGNDASLSRQEPNRLTYSGISILAPRLIRDYPQQREIFPLSEAFDYAIGQHALSGSHQTCEWRDIGTPERLTQLEQDLASSS